jgi:hypothetical protein
MLFVLKCKFNFFVIQKSDAYLDFFKLKNEILSEESVIIKVVTAADLKGILKLQAKNQTAQGGSLSDELKPEQIQEMISDTPQIVALAEGEVVFFFVNYFSIS